MNRTQREAFETYENAGPDPAKCHRCGQWSSVDDLCRCSVTMPYDPCPEMAEDTGLVI